jgi:hypothetical protein
MYIYVLDQSCTNLGWDAIHHFLDKNSFIAFQPFSSLHKNIPPGTYLSNVQIVFLKLASFNDGHPLLKVLYGSSHFNVFDYNLT